MDTQKLSKGDLTKKRILEVARNLFYTNGFDSTSTALIAKKAHISEAAMYKYYKSKSALLIATVIPSDFQAQINENLTDLSNEQLVKVWTNSLIDRIYNNLEQFSILYTEAVRRPELSAHYVEQIYTISDEDQEVLNRIKSGQFKEVDFMLMQVGIVGALLSMIQHLKIAHQLIEMTEVPENIRSILIAMAEGNLLIH